VALPAQVSNQLRSIHIFYQNKDCYADICHSLAGNMDVAYWLNEDSLYSGVGIIVNNMVWDDLGIDRRCNSVHIDWDFVLPKKLSLIKY
jgi:hypothetical protein